MVLILSTCFVFKANAQLNQAKEKPEALTFFGGQINKRLQHQGVSLGINVAKDFILKTSKGDSIYYLNQLVLLNVNHHINGKEWRPINSQSVELQLFPSFVEGTGISLGIGAALRHYDFKTITLSPKVQLLWFYIQKNLALQNDKGITVPDYTFGFEINTSVIMAGLNRAF